MLHEKALSKKQQRFFGIVRATQKGTFKGETTPQVQRAAASMKKKDVKKFASTKHKGLPEKKINKEEKSADMNEAKYERGASTYGKASIRNKRMFGKGGNAAPPEERGAAIKVRRARHQERRYVKKGNKYHEPGKHRPEVYGVNKPEEERKGKNIKEGSLHSWFKGSKSKDGKPGWVNVVTGGTCASDKPGEGTPKCVSSSKRASMTKAERLSASRRKKKADPGQQSKSGAAKPTYVATDKKKTMKEGITFAQFQEACWKGYEKKGMKTMFGKRYPNCVKKTKKEEVQLEAKVEKFAPIDKKADIRNRRRFGKKHNKSIYGMENGKMLYRKDDGKREDNTKKRRAEHEARRGVKGAVPKKTKTVPKKKYKGIVTVANYMKKEAFSANPAQQAAIAIAKRNRKQDLKVAKKKKEMKEVKENCGCGKDPCETYGVKEAKKIPSNVKKIAKELDKAVAMHKSQAQRLRKAGVSEGKQSCPEGQYYCHDMKKCKPIPKGYKEGKDGMLVKEDMKGMSQKSGDKRSTESGAGMTAQGVAKYNRRTGGNLKTAVTTPPSKLKPGSKAAKRRKSFCARSKSWTGPRGKAARRRWNC